MLNIVVRAICCGLIGGGITFILFVPMVPPITTKDLNRAFNLMLLASVGTTAAAVAGPIAIGYHRHRREKARTQHLIQHPPKPLIESYPQGDYCLLPSPNPYHISIDDDGDEVLRAYVEWLKQSRTGGDTP